MAAESHSIIDPFHRRLHAALSEVIASRVTSLASGAAANWNQYVDQTSYLRALNDVLDKCEELERDQYGTRPSEDQPST